MFTISKRFEFSASHQLTGLPEDHPCARVHGHNYTVEVVLQSDTLDDTGFVVDFGELKPLKTYLDDTLDHRHLNDVLPFQPSCEQLAHHLYQWCRERWEQVVMVRVSETPKSYAEYSE
jgi:6-pyruvoyltetrahydropterin/6-carboxytetrahydropterin synthase